MNNSNKSFLRIIGVGWPGPCPGAWPEERRDEAAEAMDFMAEAMDPPPPPPEEVGGIPMTTLGAVVSGRRWRKRERTSEGRGAEEG